MFLRARDPEQLPEHLRSVRWRRVPNSGLYFRGVNAVVPADIFWHEGAWVIADPDAPDALQYARAASAARHPHTVYAGEWFAIDALFGPLRPMPCFCLEFDDLCTSSPERPLSLDDIGCDFFVRVPASSKRKIWFCDPSSGNVVHSGTKCPFPGVRFCHFCGACFSANNWSQHMRTHARALKECRVRTRPFCL